MRIRKNIKVPTGNILVVEGERGLLECLSLGDYGKQVNVKADFLGLSRKIDPVVHTDVMPLTEKWVITTSPQYGCSMNCKFCDVPQAGAGINATKRDIINQVITAVNLHPEIHTTKRLKSQPELAPLRDKLLAIDGLEIVPRPESDLSKLLERGCLYDLDVELRLMRRSGCHMNTALLWMDNMEENKICGGWGLSDDGLWRQHTWVINKERIIETTEERIRYFGAILTEGESKEFAFYNMGIRN